MKYKIITTPNSNTDIEADDVQALVERDWQKQKSERKLMKQRHEFNHLHRNV
ncbi:MAG TPA: hypothetical protein VFN56_01795 [Candidatus Saccharimonadales bacterium]|nr:hypothetical protein [Candidatus Saccharimonadales bacterium]